MDSKKKEALEAFDSLQYELALELMTPLAEEGDDQLMCNVGTIYQLGLGHSRDLEKAIFWLEKSAALGNALAAHNLGTLYMTCLPDYPLNPELSKKWRGRAKELGNMPFSHGKN